MSSVMLLAAGSVPHHPFAKIPRDKLSHKEALFLSGPQCALHFLPLQPKSVCFGLFRQEIKVVALTAFVTLSP